MAFEKILVKKEVTACLLCHEAACNKACPKGLEIDSIIRSLRFENPAGASTKVPVAGICENCDAPCIQACNRAKMGDAIDIKKIVSTVEPMEKKAKADLSIDFLGVHCENPYFLSSSVVGSNYEMVAKAYEMGWAGVCFKTIGLFTPNEVSPRFATLEKEDNPFVGFKNIEQISDHTLEENIDFLKRLKKDYPSKIIIASIMGSTEDEWTKLAGLMEEAGADIIECNFSCPQMVGEGLGSDVGTNMELVRAYTAATRRGTKLPILAKMTPNITDMTEPAKVAMEAGADGIAAINTIKSIMNVNLSTFVSAPEVDGKSCVGGYSGKAVKPIALRFISDMANCDELKNVPISGMGGIETWKDAIEFIALGCGTVQITTAVMQYGYRIIDDLIDGLSDYMSSNDIAHVQDIVGVALDTIVSPDDVDRDTIEYPKFLRDKCVGCGRCYISCYDGGHQALKMVDGHPMMDPNKCVGCQLCRFVCPTEGIIAGTRVPKKKA